MALINSSVSGGTPNISLNLPRNTSLIKASLIPCDMGVPTINFMFNPTELTSERTVVHNESKGSQAEQTGAPKQSFSRLEAEKVTLSKLLFDTYETGDDVVKKYIDPFIAAVEFVGDHKNAVSKQSLGLLEELASSFIKLQPNSNDLATKLITEKTDADKRTPHYRFVWGSRVYLKRCAIEKLTYKLTLFLPDGTPVRAVVDNLTLRAVDESKENKDPKASNPSLPDRQKDTMSIRLKADASFRV